MSSEHEPEVHNSRLSSIWHARRPGSASYIIAKEAVTLEHSDVPSSHEHGRELIQRVERIHHDQELDPAVLLQKIESLSVKVSQIDKQQRTKENLPLADSTEQKITNRNSKRPVLKPLSTASHVRQLSSRSATPIYDHLRTASATQDLSFLGPSEEFPKQQTNDSSLSDAQQIIQLKAQLALALQSVEAMKSELHHLRQATVAESACVISDDPAQPPSEEAADLKEEQIQPSTRGTSLTTTDEDHINSAGLDQAEQYAFPRLDGIRKQASPLPSPHDPGVATAFLRGTLNRTASSNASQPAQHIHKKTPSTFIPNLERRQSEPCLTVPVAARDAKSILPRYDHLTFFPGTSNTPSPSMQPSNPLDVPGIWNSTPAPPPSQAESASVDYDSIQDRTEHISYRKIIERNTEMNWSVIVDKIVYSNDQQASIALQQKLKVAPTDQKSAIIDAIIVQAYPLMVNRFGNFLIQRCFEHGTQEQIEKIASAIHGNVLTLSKDAFGCHVVQKALDNISDEMKTAFLSELLTEIKETITHRYACHVWQKLFEVRWVDKAPEIMSFLNAELTGCWHQVALGETGSLVVQNIFENCIEEERRPCIDEVLANVKVIIRGQWGNWVIQHIVELGSEDDREKALQVVLANAVEYSVDQYASKVIEKAIKTGDSKLLARYLEAITKAPTNNRSRPRMPLIDIASDQYGNYLVQYILTNGTPEQKSLVASHIRKHMVSMRGSRYGAKVAFTVERMRHGDSYDLNAQREYRSNHNRGRAYHGGSQRNNIRSGIN